MPNSDIIPVIDLTKDKKFYSKKQSFMCRQSIVKAYTKPVLLLKYL